MATNQVTPEAAVFPNADKLLEFIEAEPDDVVRSILRLVHTEFLLATIDGKRPIGSFDVLFGFELVQAAARRKDALEQALKGNYGDPNAELEWT